VFADSYNVHSGHYFSFVKSDFLLMRVSTRNEKMEGTNYNTLSLIKPVKGAEKYVYIYFRYVNQKRNTSVNRIT